MRRGYKIKLQRLKGPDEEVAHSHSKNFGFGSQCNGKPWKVLIRRLKRSDVYSKTSALKVHTV